MKVSIGSLFAVLLSTSLLAGCAATGSTPTSGSANEATATTQAPASETKAPAKSGGGAEPECD